MGRYRKNSDELSRPRVVIAPPQPVSSRPKRSTKDAFYTNLGSLTMTKKIPIPIPEPKIRKKKEILKKVHNHLTLTFPVNNPGSSEACDSRKFVSVPVRKMSIQASAGEIHEFISQLRNPRMRLAQINIFPVAIDPRLPYMCDLCSLRCPTISQLETHLGTHVENFQQCSLCEKPEHPFSMREFTEHVTGHFFRESHACVCIFCGEVVSSKTMGDVVQHLLFYCPEVTHCMICGEQVTECGIIKHRQATHDKLMNRYICATCFCGFPSLSPFLMHICTMTYRCHCEISDTFKSHEDINKHIDDLDEIEIRYHGILMPQVEGRKRCHFVNPHAVMPATHPEESANKFGFRAIALPADTGLTPPAMENQANNSIIYG